MVLEEMARRVWQDPMLQKQPPPLSLSPPLSPSVCLSVCLSVCRSDCSHVPGPLTSRLSLMVLEEMARKVWQDPMLQKQPPPSLSPLCLPLSVCLSVCLSV